jgi:hypothetical protein
MYSHWNQIFLGKVYPAPSRLPARIQLGTDVHGDCTACLPNAPSFPQRRCPPSLKRRLFHVLSAEPDESSAQPASPARRGQVFNEPALILHPSLRLGFGLCEFGGGREGGDAQDGSI